MTALNIFEELRRQQKKEVIIQAPDAGPASARTSTSAILPPFSRRPLTPAARPGQTGYSHREMGQCPSCGKVGKTYQLQDGIKVTFCDTHKVSLPVPQDF